MSDSDLEVVSRWALRRATEGRTIGLIELYEMVAEQSHLSVDELALERRHALADVSQATLWPGFERVRPSRFDADIVVVPPRSEWFESFRALHAQLSVALPEARIEHVGSTSIPGLAAKPIVDVMVSVVDVHREETYRPAIETLGVVLFTRDDAHRFFCAPLPFPRTVHMHVCEAGGHFEREHILFRDYLRTHDEDARRYEALKLSAAQQWADDRFGYTYAKNSLIVEILTRAEQWAVDSAWATSSGTRP